MTSYGLRQSDLDRICETIKGFPQVDEAILFGSRALNRHKKGSDIDIAIKGKELGELVSQLAGILNEETASPFHFDLLDYHLIDNPKLKDHIDRVGILLYKKSHK